MLHPGPLLTNSTSKDGKLRAEAAVKFHWQEAEMIGERIDQMTPVDAFRYRANECIKAKGYNFFHG